MKQLKLAASIPILLLLAIPMNAAIVIDFESLAGTGGGFNTPPIGINYYEEDGFILQGSAYSYFFAPHTDNADFYAGSTALWIYEPAVTLYSPQPGELFDLVSIDLGEMSRPDPHPATITFFGYHLTGPREMYTVTLDGVFGFETFVFPSTFNNLLVVDWVDFSGQLGHQEDNITINRHVAAVPEVASFLTWGCLLSIAVVCAKYAKMRMSL